MNEKQAYQGAHARSSQPEAEEMPEPIPFDPNETGAIEVLSSEDAITSLAQSTKKQRAAMHEQSKHAHVRLSGDNRPHVKNHEQKISTHNKKFFIGIACVVALIIIVAVVGIQGFLQKHDAQLAAQNAPQAKQVGLENSLSYKGSIYSLVKQSNGKYSLMCTENEGTPNSLIELEGAPLGMIQYNGILYIPENFDGSWGVIAQPIDPASSADQMMDGDNPVAGKGKIASIKLQDNKMVLVMQDNSTHEYQLP